MNIKMGWFNKKEVQSERREVPLLPELPKLPELPSFKEEVNKDSTKPVYQLPSFPNNSFGEKFSQNAIKDAVTGKEDGEEVFDADEFAQDTEMQRMQKPLKESLTKDFPLEQKNIKVTKEHEEVRKKAKEVESIFVRIDKFEEGLEVFEKTKEKISDMEKMLKEIKKINDEEEKQLEFWEKEIQIIKGQIEKVDNDIFSRVE